MRRALVFLCYVVFVAGCHGQVVTTFAGAAWVFPGAGGPALNGPLGRLGGVVVDSSGTIFLSDFDNLLVLKIDHAGTLTIVAGNGRGTSADITVGENVPARNEPITPSGLALDANGNLYICDAGSERIRKVTPAGIISTVAGNGTAGFSGDGGPAASAALALASPGAIAFDGQGNLYIADTWNNRVRKVTPVGTIITAAGVGPAKYAGDGGPATSATLNAPIGIAIDASGNLYIADTKNNRIRKVGLDGTITTAAGTGASGNSGDGGPATAALLNGPSGVVFDASGNLYIAEANGNRVRRVTPGGIISTVAGSVGGTAGFGGDGALATSALLNSPNAAAVDSSGNLYISDSNNNRVRELAAGTGVITTLAGGGNYRFGGDGGPAINGLLHWPTSAASDGAGNIYVADSGNLRVRKVDSSGIITTIAGGGTAGFGEGGPSTQATLSYPLTAIALDAAGNVFIASGNQVRKISSANHTITTVVNLPNEVLFGDDGPAISTGLNFPHGLAFDAAGNLYISDTFNNIIRKVTPAGYMSTVVTRSSLLQYPTGLAVDNAGDLYIADSGNRICKLTPSGVFSTIAGSLSGIGLSTSDGIPATRAQLAIPTGVTVDSKGNLYFSQVGGNPIRKVDTAGIISSIPVGNVVVTSGLDQLTGLSMDAGGNLYVADSVLNTVYKVAFSAAGTVPAINNNGIVNVASYNQPPLTPGSIAAVFGTNLGLGVEVATSTPLPTTLQGARVMVNGIAAPLFFVSPTQINFQIPWEVSSPPAAAVSVTLNGSASVGYYTTLGVSAPGIFSADASGTGQGAILNANTPSIANTTTPALRGGYVSIFCTGLGLVASPPATGAAAGSSSMTVLTPTVNIGGIPVTPSYSGLAPGFIGLYQVNVQIPQSVPLGPAVPITLSVDGVTSNQVTLAIL